MEVCLKCGKKGHAWHKCWTKEPVTARVAATRKRKRGTKPEASDEIPAESKKGRITAVVGVQDSAVPKTEKPEASGSLFCTEDDSDGPEVY